MPDSPVNFMFLGYPKDQTDYTRDRIEIHMQDDWDIHAVGGRIWRTDADINFYCKDDQRMYWEGYPGETSDKTDWHGSTSRLAGVCGNQHHARFWDDKEHARITGDHGREKQWAVGGIHHEKVITKWCKTLGVPHPCLGHKIDRDWDQVRYQMVTAMHKHCAVASWRYHPGADNDFQGFDNSGFVARISLHHVADGGCDGW